MKKVTSAGVEFIAKETDRLNRMIGRQNCVSFSVFCMFVYLFIVDVCVSVYCCLYLFVVDVCICL